MKRDKPPEVQNKKSGVKKPTLILLKEGDLCPHCRLGRIKRGSSGDLECEICGLGRLPRRC